MTTLKPVTAEWAMDMNDFGWHRVMVDFERFTEEGHAFRFVLSACDRMITEYDPENFQKVRTPTQLPLVGVHWPCAGLVFHVCGRCAEGD